MICRWCVALVLATALAVGVLATRGPSVTAGGSHREHDRGAYAALASSPHDTRVDLVVPARRVVPEASAKPLLQALAALGTACGLAFTAVVLRRRRLRSGATRSRLHVPCGLRAPPSLCFA